MKEQWKEIPNRPGFQASNLGRIKSPKGKILKSYLTRKRYEEVKLWINGKGLAQTVHKLVMWTFGPPKGDNTQINHKNGVKTDNRIENLEWCTNGQNSRHAYDLGLKPRLTGERNGRAKLRQEDVDYIRSITDWKYGDKKKLCDKYNITETHIQYILKNQSWVKN